MSRYLIVLLTILMFGIFLRFNNITQQGIFLHDEAAIALEGKFLNSAASFVFRNWEKLKSQGRAALDPEWLDKNLEGIHMNTAKPGHALLVWLASLIFGFHDYTALLVSAFLGIMTVIGVFVVGRTMFDNKVGLVAAATMAVSEYHVMYSRMALAEIDGAFFFLLGTYCYYLSRRQNRFRLFPLVMAGFCIGFAFTTHYRWLLMPLIILLYELQLFISEKGIALSQRAKRMILLSVSMSIPVLLFEAPYRLLILFFGRIRYYPFTYFEQLNDRFIRYHGMFNLKDVEYYLRYLWEFEGLVICGLLGLGVYTLVTRLRRQFSIEYFIIATQFIVPLIFWSIYSNAGTRFPRTFSMALPAMALVVGVAAGEIIMKARGEYSGKSSMPSVVLCLLIVTILTSGMFNSIELTRMKSGYREAVEKAAFYSLRTGRPVNADLGHWPIWKLYAEELSRGLNVPLDKLVRESGDLRNNLMVVDLTTYFESSKEKLELVKKIEAKYQPVVIVPQNIDNPLKFEQGIWWKEIRPMQNDQRLKFIKLYDMTALQRTTKIY